MYTLCTYTSTFPSSLPSPSGSRRGSRDYGGVSEKHFRPKFRKIPVDRDAQEGAMTRFDCVVTGRPIPELLWFRDGTQVHDDQLHKIVVNEDGIHSLIIHAVQPFDTGHYTCIARNKAGEDTCQVNLNVHRKSFILYVIHKVSRLNRVNVKHKSSILYVIHKVSRFNVQCKSSILYVIHKVSRLNRVNVKHKSSILYVIHKVSRFNVQCKSPILYVIHKVSRLNRVNVKHKSSILYVIHKVSRFNVQCKSPILYVIHKEPTEVLRKFGNTFFWKFDTHLNSS